jgi:hypothetical protein
VASEAKPSPSVTWKGADIPRIPPGDYQAVCIGWQGPEWCFAYRRWSLRLEFSLLTDGTRISAFLNLGSDKTGMQIRRRSRFYAAWSQANGEMPRQGQQMPLETFTEPGLLYTVRVADIVKDEKAADKPDAMIYSCVTEILKVERP